MPRVVNFAEVSIEEQHLDRAVSAYPGYWPLACGECHLEVFRTVEDPAGTGGSRFRLYVDAHGRLWGALLAGALEPIAGAVVCLECDEKREERR